MDGYAVVSSDGPGEYPVVGDARAGCSSQDLTLSPGQVAYITTGAPVPPGADAVVKVEDTQPAAAADGDAGSQQRRVVICKAVPAGKDIRQVGSDIEAGAVVLQAGERVGVAEVGILATVGAASLPVHRRPRLAVLSTGDEVVAPETANLGPGQIRDCNRAMLLAAAAGAGADAIDLGIARDVEGHLEGCLDKAIAAGVDVLVTSGAVSMGDRDLLKPLLERKGSVHFGRVLMKPGKPLTFATLSLPGSSRQLLVFGLPGNPVSSFVCFNLVVVPALRKMSGWAQPQLRRMQVVLTSPLKLDPERPEYHRVVLGYGRLPAACGAAAGQLGWFATSTGNQISSRLLSARSANALLELPRAEGVLEAGSTVSALLIDDLGFMPQAETDVPATEGFFA
ncbi:hypothetical protein OEZ86_008658 [Tetradesmus obliquus]|nr:hypothetical protein OEZ86_008658 [Tetradesmus obliquus]